MLGIWSLESTLINGLQLSLYWQFARNRINFESTGAVVKGTQACCGWCPFPGLPQWMACARSGASSKVRFLVDRCWSLGFATKSQTQGHNSNTAHATPSKVTSALCTTERRVWCWKPVVQFQGQSRGPWVETDGKRKSNCMSRACVCAACICQTEALRRRNSVPVTVRYESRSALNAQFRIWSN